MANVSQDGDSATEETPLVASQQRRPPARPGRSSVASLSTLRVRKAKNANTIVLLLCLATFIAACAVGFTLMPLTRIIEDILCREHYGFSEEPIEEKYCKIDSIQSQLAVIIAVTGAIEGVTGCLGALPWGIAADKIGRKPVIVLALSGIALNLVCAMTILSFWRNLPIQVVWVSGIFQLLGGGQAIIVGGVLSIMSDIASEEQRATIFLRLHIASLSGNLASPALASLMMANTGPWPCLWVALGLLLTGGMGFVFVPETMQPKSAPQAGSQGFQPVKQLRESLSMLKSPALIILLLISLTTAPVLLSTLAFLVQFVSKRYGIPIYATGYIQTGYGVVNIIFALILLPYLSKLLLKEETPQPFRMANERDRDLILAKWSYGFLVIGAVVLALAPTLPVFLIGLFLMGIGSGYNSLTRSLISFFIAPENRSRVFSLVGMVEVVGNIYSQPMLAGLFSLGMGLKGDVWIGLPYFGLAVLLVISTVLLFFVRIPARPEEHDEPPPPYQNQDSAA